MEANYRAKRSIVNVIICNSRLTIKNPQSKEKL